MQRRDDGTTEIILRMNIIKTSKSNIFLNTLRLVQKYTAVFVFLRSGFLLLKKSVYQLRSVSELEAALRRRKISIWEWLIRAPAGPFAIPVSRAEIESNFFKIDLTSESKIEKEAVMLNLELVFQGPLR